MSSVKKELFAVIARAGKALGNPHRLELLELLAQGPRPVEALARVLGASVATTSHHLQQLRQAGLAVGEKRGKQVVYRLSGEDVAALLIQLRTVAEAHLAEVQALVRDHLEARDALEPVPADVLLERARTGEVLVLDVRPPEEYAAGHLPGAVNVPLEELEARLAELPEDREVVAYCRGPHCVLAFEAVARLRRAGRHARRLEGGLPEWRQAGLPVEADETPTRTD